MSLSTLDRNHALLNTYRGPNTFSYSKQCQGKTSLYQARALQTNCLSHIVKCNVFFNAVIFTHTNYLSIIRYHTINRSPHLHMSVSHAMFSHLEFWNHPLVGVFGLALLHDGLLHALPSEQVLSRAVILVAEGNGLIQPILFICCFRA